MRIVPAAGRLAPRGHSAIRLGIWLDLPDHHRLRSFRTLLQLLPRSLMLDPRISVGQCRKREQTAYALSPKVYDALPRILCGSPDLMQGSPLEGVIQRIRPMLGA